MKASGCFKLEGRKDGGEDHRGRHRGVTRLSGERGAVVQHPEESVLVDFGSVKSQKNIVEDLESGTARQRGRRGAGGEHGRA